jgi:hypothetical protein
MALLVPVALAWDWVGTVWGLYALALAWAAGRAAHAGREAGEVRALTLLGWAMALLASLRWAWHLDAVVDPWAGTLLDPVSGAAGSGWPLLNRWFAEGALATAAWALLLRRGGRAALAAFIGLQLVAHGTLAVELGRLAYRLSGSHQALQLTGTLVLACSGACQWVLGLRSSDARAKALVGAGYTWLAVASCKLLVEDLAGTATLVRALALLGVGAIFLAAALVGNRHRSAGGGAA